MNRLAEKVKRSALLACLEAWERYADACVRKYSEDLFGTDPAWADEQWSRTLNGIRKLSPEHRNVAIQVLTARMSDPPWDLRDLPRNAAFLDTLRARGLATTPWLEGVAPVEEHGLVACFEEDPLEAALMGWHFQTCLRPGGMNYFSVWSNLIDINKRVVYVRRGRKVVGRCLVGLTDVGGMVTFHVYAMEDPAQITELVQRYVGAVAHAMGTVLLPQGQVPTVVARHWYDDGPQDLGGQFPDLEEGSDYREALCEAPLDEIAARVGDAFGELGLSALTLPLFLNLPELDERPELLYGIADTLMQADLSTESWLTVAELLCKLNDAQLSQRLLGHRLPTLLTHSHRRRGFLDGHGMALLIHIDPISALWVLRQTRPRRRTDPIRPQRLLWEGRSYARLERKNRAIDAFTRLIEAFPRSGEARKARHAWEALR